MKQNATITLDFRDITTLKLHASVQHTAINRYLDLHDFAHILWLTDYDDNDDVVIEHMMHYKALNPPPKLKIIPSPGRQCLYLYEAVSLLTTETRRMAIANGTCISFCNQPKAQFGYLQNHANMLLPSPILWVEAFGYRKRV